MKPSGVGSPVISIFWPKKKTEDKIDSIRCTSAPSLIRSYLADQSEGPPPTSDGVGNHDGGITKSRVPL